MLDTLDFNFFRAQPWAPKITYMLRVELIEQTYRIVKNSNWELVTVLYMAGYLWESISHIFLTGTLHYFDAESPLKKCKIVLLKHDLYQLRPYGKGKRQR